MTGRDLLSLLQAWGHRTPLVYCYCDLSGEWSEIPRNG